MQRIGDALRQARPRFFAAMMLCRDVIAIVVLATNHAQHWLTLMHLPDQVQRTALDLVVDAADVLAQDTYTHQLYATEEEHADNRAGVAGDHGAEQVDVGDAAYQQQERVHQGEGCGAHAGHQAQPQRLVAEAEDRVERILQQLPEGLLWLAAEAILAIVIDDLGRVADPRAQSRKIAIVLGQGVDRVNGLAIEQAEDAGVKRDREVREV